MTFLLAAVCFSAQSLVPVIAIDNGNEVPIDSSASGSEWSFALGDKPYRISRTSEGFELSPPAKLNVIFAAPEGARPARYRGSARIASVYIGELNEGPANALLFPDETVASFGDALGGIKTSSRGVQVRAEFSSSISTLSVQLLNLKIVGRTIPTEADPLPEALARFADKFGGRMQLTSPKPLLAPETEDGGYPFATLAALSNLVVSLDSAPWTRWRDRAGTAYAGVTRLDGESPEGIPEIIAVHVGIAGKPYTVLCVFNFWDRARSIRIVPDEMGLPAAAYVAFDFWRTRNLGTFVGDLILTVPAQSVRVVSMREAKPHPQVLGTDAHVVGECSVSLTESWSEESMRLTGRALAPSDKPFNVFISQGGSSEIYGAPTVIARNGKAHIHANNGFYRLELQGDANAILDFDITFADRNEFPDTTHLDITASAATPWAVSFALQGPHRFPNAGYYLYKNDAPLGYTPDLLLTDEDVSPAALYTYKAIPVGFTGALGEPQYLPVTPGWPTDIALHRIPYARYTPAFVPPRINETPQRKTLTLSGRPIAGLSLIDGGSVEFVLSRAFATLESSVLGLSRGSRLRVLLDGETAWESRELGESEMQNLTIDLSQAFRLRIEASSGDVAVVNPLLRAKPRP